MKLLDLDWRKPQTLKDSMAVALKSKVITASLAGLALTFAGSSAQTDTYSLPTYSEGDTFIFSNGRVEYVADATDGAILWRSRKGREYYRSTNFVVPILEWDYADRSGERMVTGAPDALWPLEVGNKTQFQTVTKTQDEKGRLTGRRAEFWKCAVRAFENVETMAGAFEAYRIICDRYSANTMTALRRIVWHFAPEIGHYVKREDIRMRTGVRRTYTLAASLSGYDANPARIRSLVREVRRATREAEER